MVAVVPASGTPGPLDGFGPPADGIGSRLPVALGSFLGREAEIVALTGLIAAPMVRLLTLTGPGGVGKTRLALRVAEEVSAAFPGGVWFVGLDQLQDPELTLATIGRALQLPDMPDRQIIAALRRLLDEKPALFVLDNFERVIDAAPRVLDLLAGCPAVTALVTSRMVLRVRGEQEFPVAPLPTPEPRENAPESIGRSPAVALFVERAILARSGAELGPEALAPVAEICRRLDGLPLAIELAAARSRYLSPLAILARLDQRLPLLTGGDRDVPVRHQTMRNAIVWSYDLLSPDEQALFRQLAVFAGGFTLEAAEAVAVGQEPLPATDILDGLGSLLDKSLVIVERSSGAERGGGDGIAAEPRYRLLETIREFGLEALRASGDEAVFRARHATWYRTIAGELYPRALYGPLLSDDLNRYEGDWENMRAALVWLSEQDDTEGWITFAADLTPFWYFRSRRWEGRRWLERAVRIAGGPATADHISADLRARVFLLSSWLSEESAEAVSFAEEALAIWRGVNDPAGGRLALLILTIALNHQGQYERALATGREARPLLEAGGLFVWAADCDYEVGLAAYGAGDLALAVAELERSVALHRTYEDLYGAGMAVTGLGLLAVEEEALAKSAELFREGLGIWLDLGTKEGLVDVIGGLGVLAQATGQPRVAARFFGAAAGLGEIVGYLPRLPERTRWEQATALARVALGDDVFEAAMGEGRSAPLSQILVEARGFDPAGATGKGTDGKGGTPAELAQLTSREIDVLRLLMDGCRDREIAERLGMSPKTAMRHVANIFGKLEVQSRTQAASRAREAGLRADNV